ncbi:MAG: porin, partial [Opitutaceae bacterium]
MTSRFIIKGLALAASLLAFTSGLRAQDNASLLNALVRKGILTDQEAEDLRADVAKENTAALASTSKSPNLEKLTLSGRFQSQFVALNTDNDSGGAVVKPASSQHFFLRRVYIGVKPQFSANWSAYLNYDFAGSTFDAAQITWAPSPQLVVDVGFRKVPFGYDENFISSGALKAIERSPITRFFVESNNGRRLGAGSYRQGVFVGGASPGGGLTYNLAVTNPERDESAAGAAGVGTNANNNLSYWGNVGYGRKFGPTLLNSWKVGLSVGELPDQGGPSNANLGRGYDLSVYSAYADLYYDKFSLVGEAYWSKNDKGVSLTRDAEASGWWIQPSYRYSQYEFVARYTEVDSDGRGVLPGDLVRSAPNPTGITFGKLNEWYVGFNWYL